MVEISRYLLNSNFPFPKGEFLSHPESGKLHSSKTSCDSDLVKNCVVYWTEKMRIYVSATVSFSYSL